MKNTHNYVFKIDFKSHINLHLKVKVEKSRKSCPNIKFLCKCHTVKKSIGTCRQKQEQQMFSKVRWQVTLNKITLY